MEISFHDNSILDVSIEVVIDWNNNDVPEGTSGPCTSTPIATKQKVDLFSCPSCPYNTNSRGNLYRHKRSVHQKKKEECPTCGKTYASSYDLRTHVRVVHGETPFLCESCSQRFNNRAALKRHRDEKHANVCKFICATCGKKYHESAYEQTYRFETVFM
ncbi:hypothetical protein DPMN_008539 [Dreissena polymorpha]|uniref:C2H2-type domain-containing protein n=1 Tax=Dreissena polymorpha TaxID=45954 RepID=A0A9D4MXY8_DREPO|nr:hypothetical protein DPMN_008539 [Dreissena polymorpha]